MNQLAPLPGRARLSRGRVRRYVSVAAACLAAVTCTLVEGVGTGAKIVFTLQASDTLQVVGTTIPYLVGPNQPVDVTRGTAPLVGAKVQLGSDNRTAIDVSGDTLKVLSRGLAHITVTLLGSNLGDNPPETTLTVHAVAGGVAVRDSSTITLKSINDTFAVKASVLGLNRTPIAGDTTTDSLRSSDTTVIKTARVTGDPVGRIIARGNGTATLTLFADTARTQITVTVSQTLRKYGFSPTTVTLGSLNVSTNVTLTPQDGRGNAIPPALAGAGPTYTSLSPGVFTVTGSGTYVARVASVGNNPNANVGAILQAAQGPVVDSVNVFVTQVAKNVTITAARVDTIFALQDTLALLATAIDSNNVGMQAPVIWSTSDGTIAAVNSATGVVRGVALGTARIAAKVGGASDSITVTVINVPRILHVTHNVALNTLGDSATIADTVFNKILGPIPGIPVTFRALDTTIATVGASNGIVVARSVGTTRVVGSIVAGAVDTSVINVQNLIATVKLASRDTSLQSIGDTVSLRTAFTNARGAPVPASAARWASTDSTTVTVVNGFLTARGQGLAVIYAFDPQNAARFDSARITVTNAPASVVLNRHLDTLTAPSLTLQYTADVRNARGALIANPTLTWIATNATASSVTANGLATALAVGSTKIVAQSGTSPVHADTATLVIVNNAVSLNVSPATLSVSSIGATAPLTANARNAVGGAVSGVSFQWTSSDTTVARVDTTGLVKGMGVGTATVTAKLAALTASASVTVTNAPDTIKITSPPITLASINDTTLVAVTLKNALGAALPATAAQWLSDDGTIARVTSDGHVIAVAAGVTKVRAQNPINTARRDSVTVTVTNAPAAIIVSPHLDTLPSLGRTATFTATVSNARSAVIVGASTQWISRAPSIVSVNASTGVATSVSAGTAYVVGTSGSVSDSGLVVVSNLATSVAATPSPVTLTSVGQTQALTVTVRNEQGNIIVSPPLSFTTSDGTIATVSGAGVITAAGVGSATITVTSSSVSTPVTVTVTNYPTLVDITSNDTTLASINDSYSASVNFRNGLNAVLPRDAVTWSTGNQLVATVSSTGVINAVGAGTAYIRAVSPGNATVRDSILVTVTNAPATLSVAPAGTTTVTAIGVATNYTASVKNARGDSIASPNPAVTWTSRTPAVATVSGTGVVTSVAQGSAVIVATAGVAKDSATVTVAQAASPALSVIQTSASSVTADGASTVTVTVRARDANGRNLRTTGTVVTITLSGSGTLSGLTTVNDSTTTATITAPSTAGSTTVGATVNGAAISSGSPTVTYTAAAATKYLVTSSNFAPAAGTQVTITAQLADVNSNAVGTAGKTVTWSSTGGGSFSNPTSLTNASGVATITFTTNPVATTHIVTATDNTSLTGSSQPIVSTAAAATHYVVTASSTSPTAGSKVAVTAQLTDANGNAVATAGRTVTWTKSDPNGSFVAATSNTDAGGRAADTLTTHTVAGTATTVTANDGTNSGTSGTITTVAGAASQLTVTQAPTANPQSGVVFATQPKIQLRDGNSNTVSAQNVSVTAAVTAGGGTLSGVTTIQTDVNGLATFTNLAVSGTAGSTPTITFSSSGLTSVSDVVTIASGAASQVALNAGTGQSAAVATSVATAPSVVVRDASNNAVAGVSVTFTVTGGGGQIDNGGGLGAGPLNVTTNGSGVAALTAWQLGTAAGSNTLTASAAGLTGSPVSFTATATAGAAATIAVSAGNGQTAAVGTAVATAPSVLVTDAHGNPVSGTSVVFAVATGGGSISSPTGNTVTTNGSGIAALSSWQLGPAAGTSNNSVTATATGLAGSPVTFTASATAGVASQIALSAGNGQSAAVGTAVTTPPSALVRDAFNNPVAGVSVTFTVTAGSGLINSGGGLVAGPLAVNTNASGIAALTAWQLGAVAGSNTLTGSATGLAGSPVTFTATGTSTATHYSVTSSSASPAAGATVTITAQLLDASNNPVPTSGKTVTWSRGPVSGSFAAASSVTDGTGAAAVVFTPVTTAGTSYTVTGTDNTALTGTSSSITVQPAALHHFALSLASPQASGVAFTGTNTLTAQDAFNNTVTSFSAAADNVTVTTTLAGTVSGLGSLANNVLNQAGDFVSGVANLTGSLTYTGTSGTGTFTATSVSGKSGTSGSITIGGGTATHFVITGSGTQTAGGSQTVTITARDASNNTATGYAGTKSLTFSGASSATTGQSPTASNNGAADVNFGTGTNVDFTAGVATSTIKLYKAETATLVATQGGLTTTGADRLTVVVSAAALDNFLFTLASPQSNGATFTGTNTLTARDVYSNTKTTFDASADNVTIAANAPLTTTAGAISGLSGGNKLTSAGDFVSGVASLTGTLTYTGVTGSGTFTATSASGKSGTSASVTVSGGAATHFVITGSGTQTAGSSQTVTITAQDASNNTASGYTGTRSLTFSGANSATQSPTASDNGAADVNFGTGTNVDFTAGVATSTIKLYKAETANIAVTDGTISAAGANRLTVTVSAAALDNFAFTLASPQNVGAAFTGTNTLTARDAFNNVKTTFDASADNVTIAASAPLTTTAGAITGLSGGNKLTSAGDFVSGVATITTLVYTGTTGTGTFTATSASAKTGTSGAVQVDAGTATHLAITGTGTQSAGTTQTVTITALDAANNTAAGYAGAKSLTFSGASNAPDGTVPTATDNTATPVNFGTPAAVTFTAGVATSTVALYKAETAVIAATDGTISATGGNRLSVTVSPADASLAQSTVSASPLTGVKADGTDASTVTVQLKDAFRNITTTGVTTVSATTTGTNVSLSAFASGGGGSYTASLTTTTAQDVAVTAKLDGSTITNGSNPVTVTFVASHLVLTGSATQTAGQSQTLTITARDADGNTVTTFSGAKNLIFSGASDALTGQHPTTDGTNFGTSEAVTFTNGVGSVSLILYRTETAAIAATTTAPTTPTIVASGGDRLSVTVTDAGVNNFAFVLAGTQTSGVAFIGTNTLTARDVYNNTVVGFDASADNVVVAPNGSLQTDGGAVSGLSGGNALTSNTDFVNGVANLTGTFTFTLVGTPPVTGTFTATSQTTNKTGTSNAVTIN